MLDPALKNAEAKRDALADRINAAMQQVEEWRRELRNVEGFIRAWHDFAGVDVSTLASRTMAAHHLPISENQENRTRSSVKNPGRDEVRAAVRAILDTAKMPIPRQNLFDELKARGIEIFGKDPEMVLSTMIWRMQDEFVRLPKFGYWFKKLPFGPAGYDPHVPYPADDEHSKMVNRDLSRRAVKMFE